MREKGLYVINNLTLVAEKKKHSHHSTSDSNHHKVHETHTIPTIQKPKVTQESTPKNDVFANHTHNYVDQNNVFGFWNLRLSDMYLNKSFNIDWSHYEIIAKRDFNITDADFSWDLVDEKISGFMIDPVDDPKVKATVHEFNRLKKNYYNWINVLNDNDRYGWDIKLADIDKDEDFKIIWDWQMIRTEAGEVTGQKNLSNLKWDLVEETVLNFVKAKAVLYNNTNFVGDAKVEKLVDDVITIKGKYRDYLFLMNNNFYFEDISKDKDFQKTINWTKVENKIEILLNASDETELNMTLVDVKIKEYQFNSKPFSRQETLIIKDLIKVERQYSEYMRMNNGAESVKNTTSDDGLMSDIGNNIHQGTGMSIMMSM